MDLAPSCRGFLNARLAGTQTCHQTSIAQEQKCSVTPVRPSWWLWLHRKAVALPAWGFWEDLQASGQGIPSRAKNPSKVLQRTPQRQESPDCVWGHMGGQMRLARVWSGGDEAGGGGRSQQHFWKGDILSREPPGWGPRRHRQRHKTRCKPTARRRCTRGAGSQNWEWRGPWDEGQALV